MLGINRKVVSCNDIHAVFVERMKEYEERERKGIIGDRRGDALDFMEDMKHRIYRFAREEANGKKNDDNAPARASDERPRAAGDIGRSSGDEPKDQKPEWEKRTSLGQRYALATSRQPNGGGNPQG